MPLTQAPRSGRLGRPTLQASWRRVCDVRCLSLLAPFTRLFGHRLAPSWTRGLRRFVASGFLPHLGRRLAKHLTRSLAPETSKRPLRLLATKKRNYPFLKKAPGAVASIALQIVGDHGLRNCSVVSRKPYQDLRRVTDVKVRWEFGRRPFALRRGIHAPNQFRPYASSRLKAIISNGFWRPAINA